MGCCIARDSETKQRFEPLPDVLNTSYALDQSADAEVVEFIRILYLKQNVKALAQLAMQEELYTSATTGVSAGSLCLQYLAKIAVENPVPVAASLEPALELLLHVLKKGSDETLSSSLSLLAACSPVFSEPVKEKLVNKGVLPLLIRYLMCSQSSIRLQCALVCSALYRNSVSVKDLFLNGNGGKMLLSLIAWNAEKDNEFETLLEYLEQLITDETGQPMPELCTKLNTCMAWDVLREVKMQRKTDSPRLDKLIRTLIMH